MAEKFNSKVKSFMIVYRQPINLQVTMDQETNNPDNKSDELETLETPSTSVVSPDNQETAQDEKNAVTAEKVIQSENQNKDIPGKPSLKKRFLEKMPGFNPYLLTVLILVIVAIGVTVYSFQQNNRPARDALVATEPLDQEVLDQLNNTDVKVGDPKQILSVEANAVFSGTVLVRGGLEVAGQVKVGGPLSLPGITVSGNSNFDEVNINNLQISGNTTVQGQMTIQGNLAVNGSATFGGTLSARRLFIQNLQINNDIQLNRHIDAGGGTPRRTNGNALGSGGTSSVSGTDTAGTVNINTGGGPGAGCFATIIFNQRFNATPHITITPVGFWAGSLNYYINRSATSFSICTRNNPSAGKNFAFDYIVID